MSTKLTSDNLRQSFLLRSTLFFIFSQLIKHEAAQKLVMVSEILKKFMLFRSTLRMIPKAFLAVLFIRYSATFNDIEFALKPLTKKNHKKNFNNFEFVFVEFFVDW